MAVAVDAVAAEEAVAAAGRQVDPLRSSSPQLRTGFPPTASVARGMPSPADGLSTRETGWAPTRPAFASGPGRWLGRTARLATLVLAATLMVGPPAHAFTAAPAEQATQTEQVERASRLGVSQEMVGRLLENRPLADTLQTLPDTLASRYKELNANQRKVMGELLEGRTAFVSHRGAFISGRAAGMDAFPRMKGRLDDLVESGKLTRAEADFMKSALDQMKTLTPRQREAIADFIELERALTGR